jgi:hypothetical protein
VNVRRIRRGALGALCSLSLAAGTADAGTLTPARIGVALSAPTSPLGSPIAHDWQRCKRYEMYVGPLDRASALWPLGDESTANSPDTIGAADGTYIGAHISISEGALDRFTGDPAAGFDGSSSALLIPHAPAYGGAVPYSIELWARPAKVDSTYRYLFSREARTSAGVRQGTGIWLSSAGLEFERFSAGVKSGIESAQGLPLGVWSYVVATYDGQLMRLFVNGRQLGTTARVFGKLDALPGPSVIGAGPGGKSGHFAGDIDEVASYPTALARAHISAHYNAAGSVNCVDVIRSATYTPTLADLGTELVGSTDLSGNNSAVNQIFGPVTDAGGQLSLVQINTPMNGQTLSGDAILDASVLGAPADKIEFDVDGRYGYGKVAEAPYQFTFHTAQFANGPHTLTVKLWGPGASTPTTTSVTVTVAN